MKRPEYHILESVSGYDAALLRDVPSHEDIPAQNVFINSEGLITGVIDWEFHMVKRAVLTAIRLGFAMVESLILGPLISFPRFGWLVRWMQKGCERNTMQYVLALFNQIPNKTNLKFQIVKKEDPEYYRKPANFVAWQRNGC